MTTTIALHTKTRRRLADLQEQSHLPSMDAVVVALLDASKQSAMSLWTQNKMAVLDVCNRYGILGLVAFGSRVWGVAHKGSDLDLVAEFETTPDGWTYLEAEEALSQAFGVPVDLHTPKSLRPKLRRDVETRGHRLHG